MTVLEAGERPGGLIRSVECEGRVLELGPQRTRLTRAVERLVRELDLEDELIEAPADLPLYVYREGKLRRVPRGPLELVRTDLLSWRGKARFLMEPLTGAARSGESVAGFLERKFGREGYLHLLGPLYGGIYASDPRSMPVEFSLGRALREHDMEKSVLAGIGGLLLRGDGAPPAVSFRRGMACLPDALCRRHASRVQLGRQVTSVQRHRHGFQVDTADGDSLSAGTVVLTVPAPTGGEILRAVAPDPARQLRALRYNPLTVVHLLSEWSRPGYGFQVSLAERERAVRGVTWNYSLFGRDGLSTAYLGGAFRPEVEAMDDSEAARRATREFTEITGAPARAIHVHRTRMPAFDESWEALARLRRSGDLPEGVHLCGSYQVRPGIPGRIHRATALAGELAGGSAGTTGTE